MPAIHSAQQPNQCGSCDPKTFNESPSTGPPSRRQTGSPGYAKSASPSSAIAKAQYQLCTVHEPTYEPESAVGFAPHCQTLERADSAAASQSFAAHRLAACGEQSRLAGEDGSQTPRVSYHLTLFHKSDESCICPRSPCLACPMLCCLAYPTAPGGSECKAICSGLYESWRSKV